MFCFHFGFFVFEDYGGKEGAEGAEDGHLDARDECPCSRPVVDLRVVDGDFVAGHGEDEEGGLMRNGDAEGPKEQRVEDAGDEGGADAEEHQLLESDAFVGQGIAVGDGEEEDGEEEDGVGDVGLGALGRESNEVAHKDVERQEHAGNEAAAEVGAAVVAMDGGLVSMEEFHCRLSCF